MKTLFKVLGVLVLLLVVALIVLYMNLDRGIKAAVEEYGPRFTGSSVTLDSVSVSPFSGEGSMSGLTVGNPEGFQAPSAFRLDDINIALDTESLTGDVIVIERLHVGGPEITFEVGRNGSNLKALQRNVARAAGADQKPAEEEQSGPERKLVIRDFVLANTRLSYSNPMLGSETATVTMPDLHLTGIGEKAGGVTAAEAVKQILAAVNRQAVQAVANSGAVDDLRNRLEGRLEEEKDRLEEEKGKLEGALDNLKGTFGR
jgi:uncharacterized protein involved in outer membrane biogenesis